MDRGLITKVQYALKQKGFIVTVSAKQLYNQYNDIFVKYYQVRHNNKSIYVSTSTIKVVKFLAEILNTLRELETKPGINKEDYIKSKMTIYIKEEKEENDKKKKET